MMIIKKIVSNLLNKQHSSLYGRLAVACVLVLSILIIGVNPFKQVLAPMDLMHTVQGWGKGDGAVVNPERSDILDFYLPRWRYFRWEIRKEHRIPIWNPIAEDGSYGIQEPSQFGINLPFLVYALWPDEPSGYTLAIIGNFLFGALGAYLLLVFMFGSRCAAIFGAITFAFSGFNIAWAYWPHAVTNACIPWVLASILRYWQEGKLRWSFIFMASVFLLGVGGFPFVSLLGCFSATAFVLVLLVSAIRNGEMSRVYWRRLACLAIAGIGAIALAAPGLNLLLGTLNHTDLTYRAGGTMLSSEDLLHLIGVDSGSRITVEKTFFCGTLAAIFSIFSFLLIYWRPNKNAMLGGLIVLFVLATAYGMAPDDIVQHIPFFDMNPWSRVGALIGLAFAILSAYFLSFVMGRLREGKWYVYGLLAYSFALIFQTGQLAYQFGIYNSKPLRSDFLPSSSSISYLAKNLKPLQSVVADGSFLFSGTLGNYRIPELLGHGFRTKSQQQVIERIAPLSQASETASLVDCANIVPGEMDAIYAGVRFYAVKSPCVLSVFQISGPEHKPSPDLNNGPLRGRIVVDKDLIVNYIRILLATYNQVYSGYDVKFELYKGADKVAHSMLAASDVSDNQYGQFDFPAQIELTPGSYDYTISLEKAKNSSPLSVWMVPSLKGMSYMADGERYSGAPDMSFNRIRKFKNHPKIFFHNGVQIIENPEVKGSGYYVASMDGLPEAVYSDVSLLKYSPDDFDLLYSGGNKGWVVAPMRYLKGWRAEINGRPASMSLFRGLFPAVYVSGATKVRFYYHPIGFYVMGEICLGILFMCFALLFLFREKNKYR
ncbi:hypothetical protein KVP10_06050 [Candidimonas humi]|uniref:Membrane protein YfhO n=1 Tax=Candidimonas humi TaxID=683355 RepID=A0ABV8NZV5_9BURK|nr:hypothetical protein [Candidimonas humi]MBV6304439.1 hypothetical protein [Candidimonas humi]